MLGLAIVGPQFETRDTPWDWFQQLSLILMASRITLLCQYGFTMAFTWKYKKTRLALALVMASFAIAVIIYLGISFAFAAQSTIKAYISWFVVAVFEVGSNIAILLAAGMFYPLRKHIWLSSGEGVIGLNSRIALIENYDFNFSQAAIGSIVSSLLIIYLLYQLYFDNVQLDKFGTTRQQIWTFLHFPFHLALVLLMEGINQFVIWRHAYEVLSGIFDPISALSNIATVTPAQIFELTNQTVSDTLDTFWPPTNDTSIIEDIKNALLELSPAANATGNVTNDAFMESANSIIVELFKIVVEDFGFTPPNAEAINKLGFEDQLNAYYAVFTLIFGYFFTSAGLVPIGIAPLAWLSTLPGKQSWRHYVGIVANFLLGLGLALLSVLLVNANAADDFGSSGWTLPLLVFVLLIALLLNRIPRSARNKVMKAEWRTRTLWV